ncbi:hypothetical protein [Nocardioides alcanivorans]|uniref:hypothetical protein n=1 Tax=Nocardioides alcanivorans TaxID=2897352 RepID=UPI001F458C57|nr:hypothetical protein [Nocardioides alcanivorans]
MPALADADQVATHVRGLAEMYPEIEFSALVANLRGVERALSSGITSLEYVISAGEGHSRANARRSTADALEAIPAIATLVHEAGGTLEVIVATAWDCPFDGPTPLRSTTEICARAVDAGADQLCLGDTIGTTVPGRVAALVESVRSVTPEVPLGVHFHNTRGSGIASAWAAVSVGVTMLDSAAGGLGGCPFAPGASGNIATEELVYLLEGSGVATGIDLAAALEVAALAEELVGHRAGSQLLRAGGPPGRRAAGRQRPSTRAARGLPCHRRMRPSRATLATTSATPHQSALGTLVRCGRPSPERQLVIQGSKDRLGGCRLHLVECRRHPAWSAVLVDDLGANPFAEIMGAEEPYRCSELLPQGLFERVHVPSHAKGAEREDQRGRGLVGECREGRRGPFVTAVLKSSDDLRRIVVGEVSIDLGSHRAERPRWRDLAQVGESLIGRSRLQQIQQLREPVRGDAMIGEANLDDVAGADVPARECEIRSELTWVSG